jgi:hypothetical protein
MNVNDLFAGRPQLATRITHDPVNGGVRWYLVALTDGAASTISSGYADTASDGRRLAREHADYLWPVETDKDEAKDEEVG